MAVDVAAFVTEFMDSRPDHARTWHIFVRARLAAGWPPELVRATTLTMAATVAATAADVERQAAVLAWYERHVDEWLATPLPDEN
jgi:hypothetical protein